ncbi:MAG: hypothetical protein HUU15_10340 [Candidatus Brocadiae bacterium]|nr:hypothetical protein [Candidatus Brocadiia bacterium]
MGKDGEVEVSLSDRRGMARAIIGLEESGAGVVLVVLDERGKPIWVSPTR